jgi:hypothetical protein
MQHGDTSMLDPETTRERVLLLQRLRELNTERMEQEIAYQQRTWQLLEEKSRATIERLATCKIPRIFETELIALRTNDARLD